jgi:hypothetical protein
MAVAARWVTAPRAAQVQRLEDACQLLPGATAPARGRGAADGREGRDEGAEGAVRSPPPLLVLSGHAASLTPY